MDHLGLKLHDNLDYIPYYEEPKYDPKDGFHAFPGTVGWKVNDRHGCELIGDRPEKFLPFLQAWLFFGLLHTVLSDSIKDLDVYQEFTTTNRRYLSTASLPGCLTRWKEYEEKQFEQPENNHETKKAYSIRMVRIQMALDRAKGVVRRYCSLDGTPPTGNEYAVPKNYETDKFDPISLSLIVLGETLSNAKAKIVEQIGFKIRGWHGDAAEGWGTSRLVRDKMEAVWCAKTLHVLKGQFCGNTTGLLAAFSLQPFLNQDHKGCTPELCKLNHVEDEKRYEVRHQRGCDQNCGWVGTEPKELQAIIKKGAIPLLFLQDGGASSSTTIKLTDTSECKDYATISHVWSDGYGNPTENKIHRCQLKFLASALQSVDQGRNKSKEFAFWIDTLAIPVGKSYNEERTIAIGRIHETFVRSRYTIVIDKGLCEKRAGDKYHEIAMRILASGWMRRLWTLQEAYLSDKIFFKFQDDEALDLEELEAMYPSANGTLNSSIPSIARSYFHSLLGTARRARIHDMTPKEGLSLIASVWKATQWRTTTHKQHEVLALATLFDLNTGRSEDANSLNEAFVADKKDDDAYLDGKMCTLLELLEKVYPGSIPAGIIFLPGQRLTKKGFGWAPRTWISGQTVDYPDPLAIDTPTTKFVRDEGLYVQLPGFLLHSSPGTSPIAQMEKGTLLRFPVDSTLSEWYEVKYADKETRQKLSRRPFTDDNANPKSYAIILPRQRPRDIREIALMVRIGHPQVQRSFRHKKETQIFSACIAFRIWVQKITSVGEADIKRYYEKPKRAVDGESNDESVREQVFGEILDQDQTWCVDQEFDLNPPPQDSILESSKVVPKRTKTMDPNYFFGAGKAKKIEDFPVGGGEAGQTGLGRFMHKVRTSLN